MTFELIIASIYVSISSLLKQFKDEHLFNISMEIILEICKRILNLCMCVRERTLIQLDKKELCLHIAKHVSR